MTLTVALTIRAASADVPPLETQGTVPHADCALAVTRLSVFQGERWYDRPGYVVTHRPSGFALPGEPFATEAAALDALARVVTFPAWLLATGRAGCAATAACRAVWRAAR